MYRILVSAFMIMIFATPAWAVDWWEEAGSENALDTKTITRADNGSNLETAARVNWEDDYVEVVAGGTADQAEMINQAHALTVANTTARHLAYEKLAEIVGGIRINADATYDRELMQDANLRTSVATLVRNARIIEEWHVTMADGSLLAMVRLGIKLKGERSLLTSTNTWFEKNPPQEPVKRPAPAPVAVAPASGLIIDAAGLGARPAMAPKIYAQNGDLIYGAAAVDRQHMLNYGLASYARTVDKARTYDRVGGSPLVVKAVKAAGNRSCDVVVSDEDAARIVKAFKDSKALDECRVAIVLD